MNKLKMSAITDVYAFKKYFSLSFCPSAVLYCRFREQGNTSNMSPFHGSVREAATPFPDRKGHNDRSGSLWQQSVKIRGVPQPGRCYEYLMLTLNWKKVRGKWKFGISPTAAVCS